MKERKSERTKEYKKLDLDARIQKISFSRLAEAKKLTFEPPKGRRQRPLKAAVGGL